MPLIGQFPLIAPLVHHAVVGENARRQLEDEGTEADDESKIIPVAGALSSVSGCESEGVTLEEAVRRDCLISETDTALDMAGLPIC